MANAASGLHSLLAQGIQELLFLEAADVSWLH